ncbi:hypothetical protein SLA2020_094200 [Shorea laevis]
MDSAVEETAKAVPDLEMDSAAPAEKQSKNFSFLSSSHELKKKQRKEERSRKEEEKAAKLAVAAKTDAQSQKSTGAEDEDMDPAQYFESRLKFLAAQKAEGKNPYPHKFFASVSIVQYVEKYGGLGNGEHMENVTEALAGRIMSKRASSSKPLFYDLHGGGAKVQVMADASKSGMDEAEFSKFHSAVKHGYIVGITGFPGKIKRGELSIFLKSFIVLSHCLHMMPSQKAGPDANVKKTEIWIPGMSRNPEAYVLKDQET